MGLIVHAQNKERDLLITFSYKVNKAPGSSKKGSKTCKRGTKKGCWVNIQRKKSVTGKIKNTG